MPVSDAANVLGVRISHPDKLLWPRERISKLELAEYYAWIAPMMLKYVEDRPLTLRPFPRGVDKPGFYLKNEPKGAPEWLRTFEDVAESTGEPIDFVVANDARTLVWLAQFNAIEVHPWLSRVDEPDHPDWAVMDLDPSDETPWDWVAKGAIAVRDCLEQAGLRSFPKLSGSSGIHVMVPIAREHPFDDVRTFFERVAHDVFATHAGVVTYAYDTGSRGRRVLMDYAQNARGKTTVAPYSVRPKPGAPVAAPIRWDELEDPELRSNRWTLRTIRERVQQVGDLFEPALGLQQKLPLPR